MQIVPAVMMAALMGAAQASAAPLRCAADSVKVGNVCVDEYEASVWSIAPANKSLVAKVQRGQVTLDGLIAGGATQLSPAPGCSPGYGVGFPSNGNWTPVVGSAPPSPGVYAVSIPGVPPSTCISWYQAEQACRLSGKRLATNQEWQAAAAGTPDPGSDNGTSDCNITAAGNPVNTGSRSGCVSLWGAVDMVGNVWEWTADWGDWADGCSNYTGNHGFDLACVGGPGSSTGLNNPAGLVRGGNWFYGTDAGIFAAVGNVFPSAASSDIGFRCAR